MERGFIQIPVVVAVLAVLSALGGTGFVAYQAGKVVASEDGNELVYVSEDWSLGTTTGQLASVIVGTTAETEGITEEKKEEEEPKQEVKKQPAPKQETSKQDDSAVLGVLQQQIDSLKSTLAGAQTPPPPPPAPTPPPIPTAADYGPNATQLPSGAIVELDANGHIVHYYYEPNAAETTNTSASSGTTQGDFTISDPQPKMGTLTATLVWQTNKESISKITISGGGLSSKIFPSKYEYGKEHWIEITDFEIKTNPTYTYEIEATKQDGSGLTKKSGTFKILNKPYEDILVDVETAAAINRELSCKQLFISAAQFLVCEEHRSGS